MTGRSPSGLQLTKRLMAAPDSYLLDYEASVEGAAELGVAWTRRVAETNRFGLREGPVALVDGELEQYMVDSLDEPETHDGQVAWATNLPYYHHHGPAASPEITMEDSKFNPALRSTSIN